MWPAEILKNAVFRYAFQSLVGGQNSETAASSNESDFREGLRTQAKYRTNDGHWVRSKAEVLIDNWLYVMGLVHAYERRLSIEAEAYCDFYVPQGRLYIEYWGYEQEPQYAARREEKLRLYKMNELNLIELKDEHIAQLDDCLPILLRQFGVTSG